MNADADIQVWLETFVKAQTSIVIPHVESNVYQHLRYKITTTQEGQTGRSSIGQSGSVDLTPNVAEALSRLAIRRSAGDRCHIELILFTEGESGQRYDFMCPDHPK